MCRGVMPIRAAPPGERKMASHLLDYPSGHAKRRIRVQSKRTSSPVRKSLRLSVSVAWSLGPGPHDVELAYRKRGSQQAIAGPPAQGAAGDLSGAGAHPCAGAALDAGDAAARRRFLLAGAPGAG